RLCFGTETAMSPRHMIGSCHLPTISKGGSVVRIKLTLNRRRAIGFGAAAAVVTAYDQGIGTMAWAQQQVLLKASDVHPAGYPTVVAVENLGKKLEKASHCRLTVQMFPSMQLGSEKDAIEQAQLGAIQFARVSAGALGSLIDELNVFNLPF